MNSEAVSKLEADPDNAGSVLGWGVYRRAPWDLQGVYETEVEARAQAKEAGEGYIASYGSHIPGTDDFIGSSNK